MNVADSVTTLPGIGSIMAKKLLKLDITTVFDLLYHPPFRYEDRSFVSPISRLQPGETCCVVGSLGQIKNEYTKSGKVLQSSSVSDSTGTLPVVWFNRPFLARSLKSGADIALYGKIDFFNRRKAMVSPDYELLTAGASTIHTARLVPVYHETAGLSSKWLRAKIFNLLPLLADDILPSPPSSLPGWKQSLRDIHFPSHPDVVEPARRRLAFDELFLLNLRSAVFKSLWQKTVLAHPFALDKTRIGQFIASLPFRLTPSQDRAVTEILADLADVKPMNRLLEGDVGSGKTVVAAVAAYTSFLNSFQTLVLAPTQILAAQHHQTLSSLFKPFGIEVGLITSHSKLKIVNCKLKIVVGTHALLSPDVILDRVGLVIIDEQHRFGVAQRALAAAKASSPHILTMTATPIPRTIALTSFADLDLSTLSDLPAGRLPTKTWVVPESKRAAAYDWIKKQNAQTFIVCPFIDESESLSSVKAAAVEHKKLQEIFSDRRLGLLHGRLKSKEKEAVIEKFRAGEYHILIATPVVEVGIDIPAASIMVIEGADRFGLAQLHQLRGRVGRSTAQSYCLLFADTPTPRLKSMETHHLGSELAEIDFRLRGPGDIYGTAQHGTLGFKIASFADSDLSASAKTLALSALAHLNRYPLLRDLVEKDKITLIQPN